MPLLISPATLAAVSLAASLFLNSILGIFGLAATSVETLTKLRNSQQVLEKVKQHHATKKTRVANRLTKRSTKRVASTALAAATVGTVAVAIVMTGLELENYCDEKASLQDDDNLLYGTEIQFDYEQCLEESQEDANVILAEAKDTVTSSVSDAFEKTSEFSKETWADIQTAWDQGVHSTHDKAREV
jgi:hypothetical protein